MSIETATIEPVGKVEEETLPNLNQVLPSGVPREVIENHPAGSPAAAYRDHFGEEPVIDSENCLVHDGMMIGQTGDVTGFSDAAATIEPEANPVPEPNLGDAQLRERHHKLQYHLSQALVEQEFWRKTVDHRFFREFIENFRLDLAPQLVATVESFLRAKKAAEFLEIQAHVCARKNLMGAFASRANGENVKNAREALEDFEENNALFLRSYS